MAGASNNKKFELEAVLADLRALPDFSGVELHGPNVSGIVGNTPLHVAVIRADIHAMGVLLDYGAKVNAKGEHGYTPLHDAVEQGNETTAMFLMARGADPDQLNDDGVSARSLAEALYGEAFARILGK